MLTAKRREDPLMNSARKPVAVVVGATSKWQADGRNTKLVHGPFEIFETADHIAVRGPFLVAQEVLPAMRTRGSGSFLISNNQFSLRGRKRLTGQSLYYPRTMMRTLAQVLTEEYSEHGVHVANVVIDGMIDSPGTRATPRAQQHPEDRKSTRLNSSH